MRGFATRFTETGWITSRTGIGFQTFAICIAFCDLPLSGGNQLPFQYCSQQVDIQSTNACSAVSELHDFTLGAGILAGALPAEAGTRCTALTHWAGTGMGRAHHCSTSSSNCGYPAFGPGPVRPAERSKLLQCALSLACSLICSFACSCLRCSKVNHY